ncbi:DUF1931 domain-containing protein [Candidatus Woesearchaeota archaeon]|nr:DUF1931 domain-containing protein [Candidatus Woesearchaeota archaeon]MBT3538223.1 DUF1931 domain-containing protein [Candidatus Woesearchaeota archaeon]MBT4696732.1 DUF1931 domain-containing protein [Candidatus Woesearchaeota archaeon]MBT4717240.1 DUF1931 domain-containing protein [Candidatus Woesearchaeota archaeon]MBT7105892.1 DUF1931 domain-containing protein [Candidatus Woesearchaeota archaeon]
MAKDVAHFFGAGKAAENLVVKAAVKDSIKGANVAGDLAEALNNVANWLVKVACERADANGRKTVMAKDL